MGKPQVRNKQTEAWTILAITGWLLIAAVPTVAQHPEVTNSVLLDSQVGAVAFDPTGNVLERGDPVTGTSMRKVALDGTVVSEVPLLQAAARAVFDSSGNLYVLGPTCMGTCPAPTATFGTGVGGVLVGRVNSAGDGFLWLDELTGVSNAYGTFMQVDSTGSVYLAGLADCSMPTTAGSFQPQCAAGGVGSAFAAKIDSTGASLDYATFLRGASRDDVQVRATAVDTSGAMYLAGTAYSSDWQTTPGAYETTYDTNGTGGFVAKLSADGSTLAYSTYFNEGTPQSVGVDGQGEAVIAGNTSNAAFPTTTGAVETTFPAYPPPPLFNYLNPAFVVKLKADGSGRVYSTYVSLLDPVDQGVTEASVDSAGDAFVYGVTEVAGLPTVNAIQQVDNHSSGGEGAIAELNPQGSAYVFSTYLGGNAGALGDNAVGDVSVESNGSIRVDGGTVANDFPALISFSNVYSVEAYGFDMTLQPNGSGPVPILFSTEASGNNGYVQTFGALQARLPKGCVGNSCGIASQGTVLLGNYGAAPLSIASIATTGEFTQTNDCPASLDAGAECAITVTFNPTAIGTVTGTLTLTGGATQTMALTGTGVAAQVRTSASALNFGVQAVGTSSAPQTLTVTNTGNYELDFSSIQTQGDFSQTNNCGGAVSANGGTCAVQVTFTPTASGEETGTLTMTSNALNSPTVISLQGGVNADFSLGPPQGGSTSQTVAAGQTATYNLALTAVGGFNGTVSLACSGAPTGASCGVSPASVNLSGSATAGVTVSVTTTARSMVGGPAKFGPGGASPLREPGWFWMMALGMLMAGIWLASRKRRMSVVMRLLSGVALLAMLTAAGCGGGGSSSGGGVGGTAAGTYTIAVKASSGSTAHTENLTLTVQ